MKLYDVHGRIPVQILFFNFYFFKKKRKEKVDLCCHVGGVWVSFIGRIKENKVNDYVLLKETVDY